MSITLQKHFKTRFLITGDLKNKDHRVRFMILEARKCEKNKEFIGFHVDNQDNLIEYVENLLERLKSEQKPDTEFP